MTIEATLSRIADALELLAGSRLESITGPTPDPNQAPALPAQAPAPLPSVIPAVLTPVPTPVPTPEPNQAPAPAYQPVQAAPASVTPPFKDLQGMVSYTMQAYQALGAERGSKIQGVLSNLGYTNINDVKPEHFASFFSQVEALKVGG